MTRRWTTLTICGLAALAISSQAISQTAAKPPAGRGESSLVGVKLYDTGARIIALYGSPLEIQPVTIGGTSIGPGGGGAGGGGAAGAEGAPGGRGGARGGGGGGGGGAAPIAQNSPNFGFGDEMLRQSAGSGGALPPPGEGGEGGGRGAGGGAGRGGDAGGNLGGGGGNDGRIVFTRWIYKRGNSKYGFVFDKFNRVVQIEAIGMQDSRVRTAKGVTFGATFGDLIKKYGAPDGYEINGDAIVVRYLIRSKVAFRLNRLGKNQPHRVTGVVVAGGKS